MNAKSSIKKHQSLKADVTHGSERPRKTWNNVVKNDLRKLKLSGKIKEGWNP